MEIFKNILGRSKVLATHLKCKLPNLDILDSFLDSFFKINF